MELNKIYQGDCLELGHEIEPGSVDLILTDLPYGTMQGIADGNTSWNRTNTEWDSAIPPSDIYAVANRVLRKNGKMVLFSQEPYTSQLINDAIPNVPFSYRMIWEKDIYGNALFAKKAPLIFFEDILVFSKLHDHESLHPLRQYFSMVMDYIGLSKKVIIDRIGQKADHTFRTGSTQFSLCTEATYSELIQVFGIDEMDGFKPYIELWVVDEQFKKDLPSTFNLWEGDKHKSNILKYKKDYDGYHPTQKPISLLEDLVKTFSNEGDLVVDLTCGSGSTCVAAQNTGRSFIGIEKEKEYVDIANERTKNHTTQTDIFDVLEGN